MHILYNFSFIQMGMHIISEHSETKPAEIISFLDTTDNKKLYFSAVWIKKLHDSDKKEYFLTWFAIDL